MMIGWRLISPPLIATHTAPNCCVMTPEVVALISTVTLSVSISATTSSGCTACPTWTVHSTMDPSVMESPMVGTGIVRFSQRGVVPDTNPLCWDDADQATVGPLDEEVGCHALANVQQPCSRAQAGVFFLLPEEKGALRDGLLRSEALRSRQRLDRCLKKALWDSAVDME